MHTVPGSAAPAPAQGAKQRRVLLLAAPPPLLLPMADVVRSMPGLQLVGSFSEVLDVVDWAMWDRDGWHYAYVDLALPGSTDAVRRLQASRRPGVVIGLVAHMWQEVREKAAALGVNHIVEKGDMIALRDDLERRLR
jgi:hypothetical protein